MEYSGLEQFRFIFAGIERDPETKIAPTPGLTLLWDLTAGATGCTIFSYLAIRIRIVSFVTGKRDFSNSARRN